MTTLPSPTARNILLASLQWSRESLPVHVFVDSEEDDSFIDSSLVEQSQIPIETLNSPKTVNALDGRRLPTVTHRTAPISLIISGNHWEHLQLYVISSHSSPVVLGLHGLCLHHTWSGAPPLFLDGACSVIPSVSVLLTLLSDHPAPSFLPLLIRPWCLHLTTIWPQCSAKNESCLCHLTAHTTMQSIYSLVLLSLLTGFTSCHAPNGRLWKNTLIHPELLVESGPPRALSVLTSFLWKEGWESSPMY